MNSDLLGAARDVLRAYDVTRQPRRLTEDNWDDLHMALAHLRDVVKKDELPERLAHARNNLEALVIDASKHEDCEHITRAALSAINEISKETEREDDTRSPASDG